MLVHRDLVWFCSCLFLHRVIDAVFTFIHTCMHVRHICCYVWFHSFKVMSRRARCAPSIPTAKKSEWSSLAQEVPVSSVKPYHNCGGISRIPLPCASCNQGFSVWLLVLVFFSVCCFNVWMAVSHDAFLILAAPVRRVLCTVHGTHCEHQLRSLFPGHF